MGYRGRIEDCAVSQRTGRRRVLIEDRARICTSRERYADAERSSIREIFRQAVETAILERRLDVSADAESAISID